MTEVTKQEMDVKMVLVTETEDIAFRDGSYGKRRTRTLQFQAPDGNYLLAERPAEDFDEELFGKCLKSQCNDVEQRLSILEERFKGCQETANSMGDIVCKLIREIAETYGLLDEDFEKKLVEVEQKYKKVL